ncbi:hypothetical protein [Reyranella sp. CPCC 100927]|uniref:hypothetical protein n=1 Tax=Reyranella sp. CPCC 100927 TaxID=2599616 RepID=UPI0011B4C4DD|nr:hypothetical protein [Reyranella sp. CPCC 100927]TWS96630.1 hypothetical protein FQU96_39065 [Reyranella sp. CPCC 100927]
MTKIQYSVGKWTSDSNLFTKRRDTPGPLAIRHGRTFGGTSAYALLGPDLTMPGLATKNAPSATGPGWDTPWTGMGGPGLTFTEDTNETWVRAHLINGEWSGSGANWNNLVAMTSCGNANHKWVEARMKTYLQNFRAFDLHSNGGHNNYWYALQYWVQASTDPWAAVPAAGDLYSYAPNMIKVTWRIVTVAKPAPGAWATSWGAVAAIPGWIEAHAVVAPATIATIGPDLPNIPLNNIPPVLVNNAANVAGVGGATYGLPAGAPAIPGTGSVYDGAVEIMQD